MDAALRPTAQNNYWQCALWSLHALGAGAAACAAARCCSKMSLAACGLELGCWWCCRVLLHDVFGSVLCGARVLVVLPDVFCGALEPGHWCRCRVRLQDVYGSACFGASVLAAAGCFCRLVAQKHILLSGFIWGRNAGLLEQIQGNMISFEFVSFFPADAERQPGVSRLLILAAVLAREVIVSESLCFAVMGSRLSITSLLEVASNSLGLRIWNVSVLGVCSVSWDLGTTSPSQPEESAVWKQWCTWQFFSDRCFWLRDFTQVTRFAR